MQATDFSGVDDAPHDDLAHYLYLTVCQLRQLLGVDIEHDLIALDDFAEATREATCAAAVASRLLCQPDEWVTHIYCLSHTASPFLLAKAAAISDRCFFFIHKLQRPHTALRCHPQRRQDY